MPGFAAFNKTTNTGVGNQFPVRFLTDGNGQFGRTRKDVKS
jgi:hypothetical protein